MHTVRNTLECNANVCFVLFSHHPYLFFNSDHQSFTFLGFVVDRSHWRLKRYVAIIDPATRQPIESASDIMTVELNQALHHNGVDMEKDFNDLDRYLQSSFQITLLSGHFV